MARGAWFALRSEYLAEASPGSRPDAWWRFEAVEPRRILGWKDAGASHRFGRDVPVEDVEFRDGQWTYVGKDTEVRTHLPGRS